MFSKIMKPLSFALAFILIITGLGYLFAPKYAPDIDTTSHIEKISRTIFNEEKDTVDFLVVGNSETYTSISPMEIFNEYGYTGFVSAIPSMKIQDVYYNLESIYQVQKPKVVLLEVDTTFRSYGRGPKNLQMTAEGWLKRLFPIFENHNRWKNIIKGSLHGYDDLITEKDPLKGYNYRIRIKKYKPKDWMKETDEVEQIRRINKVYLEKITKLCKENGTQLVLYSAPAPKNWNYKKHNAIVKYAKENDLEYVDMNLVVDKLGIDWSVDAWDSGDHLNYTGAMKTTKYMGEYLHNNCNLEDHRGDSKYDSWSNSWDEYQKVVSDKTSSW